MSLIKEISQPTLKEEILAENTACLIQMKRSAHQVFDLFWNNPEKNAQEVCDLFGTDAAQAFLAHSKLQELIYLLDSSWVGLVPLYPYTINQDGSVTIEIPPPVIEPEPEIEPEPVEPEPQEPEEIP
jgi:hypothetical protein